MICARALPRQPKNDSLSATENANTGFLMTWEETMRPNRRSVFSLPAIVLLGLTLLPCSALAQQSDVDAVKAANASFYDALSSLDIKKMEPVWAHESYVTLIGPSDKSI